MRHPSFVVFALTAFLLGAVAVCAAAPPEEDAQPEAAPAATAPCGQPATAGADLFAAEPAVCSDKPAAVPGQPPVAEPKAPPFGQGYCKCGCGVRCESSADCGGAACVRFISCC